MKKLFLRLGFFALIVLFSQGDVFAQTSVSGEITDNDGNPLIGAAVFVKGTAVGTVTDIDGKFTVTAPAGASESHYRSRIFR